MHLLCLFCDLNMRARTHTHSFYLAKIYRSDGGEAFYVIKNLNSTDHSCTFSAPLFLFLIIFSVSISASINLSCFPVSMLSVLVAISLTNDNNNGNGCLLDYFSHRPQNGGS